MLNSVRRARFARQLAAIAVCCAMLARNSGVQAQQPQNRTFPPVSEQQIKAAIERAVAHLRNHLKGGAGIIGVDGGHAALVAMALLKAEVPADTPEIEAILEKIKGRCSKGKYLPLSHHVYEAGVSLMALANADARKYKPEIQTIAEYLISRQGNAGDWDYPQPQTGDTSISQYAILGLWEASRAGVKVPQKTWDKAAGWHVSRQLPDGSFTYHPAGANGAGGGVGTHTMTMAGVASLHVTRMHLFPDARDPEEVKTKKRANSKKFGILERVDSSVDEQVDPAEIERNYRPSVRLAAIDKAIQRGIEWLSNRFTITPDTTWGMYYLYGMERMTALAKLDKIAERDWYAEGAAYLVGTQAADATWNDGGGAQAATSFGVLFLMKATAKMLGRKPVRDPRFGGGLLAGGRGLPENLNEVQLDKGNVKVRKIKSPIDELLAELENAQSKKVESAQSSLVDSVLTENPEALIGQKERLLKLARDPRAEVRRTAYWALGRTNDLRVIPLLIEGLSDKDLSCMVEARNALQFISKKIKPIDLPDEPSDAQRAAAIVYWKKWHLQIRPYDERDDLVEAPK